jgi:putative transposase
MSIFIHKSHNVSVLIYHLVTPIKYRRSILRDDIVSRLIEVTLAIQERYEIHFIEVGCDADHIHFLIQSVPTLAPQRVVQIIKSIIAREMFKSFPSLKQELWGAEFFTKGYFINTVGRAGNEKTILKYVKSQGKEKEYKTHLSQPTLF